VSTIDEKFEFIDLDIPTKQYPLYSNARAVDEMGLTQEEADAFVFDLIKAINAEIPRIEAAILGNDYNALEEIVHTITGSSSTLGSGGVSSALISFYAAVQHHDSLQKLYVHLQNVKFYLNELQEQVIVEKK
jgi:HPt (histidine-containing phosphotransfer) domain-containing protein